ncbi:MaoC family dehydratase [Nocardioides pantholopis]|uniref:MaoC family dehydratase n=1 Tax=Nocardioides pantholopis TaxID=2483798 RepID=UPI000F07CE07|nr:MaoC family dehydratase [Nocardioides pantholopis]
MRVFSTVDEIAKAIGEDLGSSDWLEVDQARVDAFADATGDHQWIHVDAERAASGPFGGTIAHGYLTLSLIPFLGQGVFSLDTPGAKLNYGVNKVRFPNPLRVGKRIRVTVSVAGLTELPAGHQLTLKHVVEIEDEAKPACVAETVVLLLAG